MRISEIKNICRKKISFILNCLIWSIIAVTANIIKVLIEYICEELVSDFVKSPDFFIPTEFAWYTKSLWLIVWTIKIASCFQIYYKNNGFNEYKKTFFPDTLICLLFIIEYIIINYLYILDDRKFKISGHSLILIMTSSMLTFESEYNFKLTQRPYIKNVFFIILSINLYTFYWTCLAFHSFLEIAIGVTISLTSVYFVYLKLYKI